MLVASGLLFISTVVSLAQEAPNFKPGDAVEAHSYFYNPPWHKAKVVSVGKECQAPRAYKVVFIGEGAEDHGLTCVSPDEIRSLEAEKPTAAAIGDNKAAGDNNPQPAAGAFKVGDRVDVLPKYGPDKAQRGTIMEVAAGGYKVHYDGCGAHFDAVVDRDELHPAATISAGAPDIRFLFGKWAMFTPSYPNTVVRGNTVYREYGMGAKAPPLQINADGTYIWYDEFGKPPVKDKWTTDAKIEGAKFNTAFTNGVVIKDSKGGLWKVYRRKVEGDNTDHITTHTMCSGLTVIGTRIQ